MDCKARRDHPVHRHQRAVNLTPSHPWCKLSSLGRATRRGRASPAAPGWAALLRDTLPSSDAEQHQANQCWMMWENTNLGAARSAVLLLSLSPGRGTQAQALNGNVKVHVTDECQPGVPPERFTKPAEEEFACLEAAFPRQPPAPAKHLAPVPGSAPHPTAAPRAPHHDPVTSSPRRAPARQPPPRMTLEV